MILVATVHANDRAARKPLTFELRRTLWLESPTTMIVEVTRAGVLGGPSSTTRSIYRKDAKGRTSSGLKRFRAVTPMI